MKNLQRLAKILALSDYMLASLESNHSIDESFPMIDQARVEINKMRRAAITAMHDDANKRDEA